MPFVPLLNRTAFTFYSGAMSAEQLVHACTERGYTAVGLCDRDGFYAAVRFYKAARKAGIRAVLGAEITGTKIRIRKAESGNLMEFGKRNSESGNMKILGFHFRTPNSGIPNSSLFAFAKTNEGYSRLCQLITRRNLEPDRFDRVTEAAAATAGGHVALVASDVPLLYALKKRETGSLGEWGKAASSHASRASPRPTGTRAPPRTG